MTEPALAIELVEIGFDGLNHRVSRLARRLVQRELHIDVVVQMAMR